MIDRGEGAQIQLRRSRLKFSRLNHIYHSHGIIVLIVIDRFLHLVCWNDSRLTHLLSSGAETATPHIGTFSVKAYLYKVIFHTLTQAETETIIYDDRSVTVETIPLRHRLPTVGFIFRENQLKTIKRDMIDFIIFLYV